MEQSTVNQRLNLIVDTFEKGVKAAFARKAGISPQGAQEILAGRKGDPSFKVLVKILESYPTLDANWLVLGRGAMLKADIITPAESPEQIEQMEKLLLEFSTEASKSMSEVIDARYERMRKQIEDVFADKDAITSIMKDLIERKVDERLGNEPKQEVFIRQFNEQIIRERIEDIDWLQREAEHIQAQAKHSNNVAYKGRLEEINHAIKLLKNTQLKEGEMLTSFNYSIGEELDATKPFSGSLAKRLGITEDAARELVTSGGIGSLHIEGQGYTVTEQAVRKYLGRKLPS